MPVTLALFFIYFIMWLPYIAERGEFVLKTINTSELLSCLLEILQKMVESGAEVYRIEESAQRICSAYGIVRTDVYATTSNIIVSVETEPGNIQTHTRRITQIAADIEKLDKLNNLVRCITNTAPDTETIRKELAKIQKTVTYPIGIIYLFYSVIAGAFYLFFGGRSVVEALISMVIGLLVGLLSSFFGKMQTNKLLDRFLCSTLASCCAFACYHLRLINNVDYVIIGNIMTLIPGIGLTNALRDLFTGDSISGTLRMIEAALLALAIACGYILTTFLFGGAV